VYTTSQPQLEARAATFRCSAHTLAAPCGCGVMAWITRLQPDRPGVVGVVSINQDKRAARTQKLH
jgi:hypothetical protein